MLHVASVVPAFAVKVLCLMSVHAEHRINMHM